MKFDSCQLANCDSSASAEICGKMYRYSIKDGTKNLIWHVLIKHRDLEEIKGKIAIA
jgi:hypothetical protein